MKRFKEERTIHEEKWMAADGTVFNSEEECIKYENTALCVLKQRYSPLVLGQTTEWDFFNIGSSEDKIDFVELEQEKDVDTCMQLAALLNPIINNCDCSAKYREILTKGLEQKSPVLIYTGNYDDMNFCPLTTVEDLIEKLKNIKKK